jgi:E3 SUMO-protein ligase PIAS1
MSKVMAQHRNTVKIEVITLDHPILTNVLTDPSLRVMVFCASNFQGGAPQYIHFPYQSEVKVNGGEVKANLRGLKNKPGSTRPVDITEALRLKPTSYPNSVEMTYALTDKERKDGLRVSFQTLPAFHNHLRLISTLLRVLCLVMLTVNFIEVLYGYQCC